MRLSLLLISLIFSLSAHTEYPEYSNNMRASNRTESQVPKLTDRYGEKEKYDNQLIKIAIIDTGYDLARSNKKLKLCKTGHYDFMTEKPQIGSAHEHGTTIGDIIGTELEEVNYCAVIYQVVSKKGLTTLTIRRAFEMAKNEGFAAINLSLSGRAYSFYEQRAIKAVAARGTVIFAAAGNEKMDLDRFCNAFPACYEIPNMFVVGATVLHNEVPAPYSNIGGRVDIWLPGETTFEGQVVEGTSFAAPRALSDYVYSLYLVQMKQ